MFRPSFLRLLCYLLVFLVFFLPPVDTDLGWHLRYGNFMLENQKLFVPNQLTYFLPDYFWPNSYTFYQILTTVLFNLGGFFALSVAYGILGIFSFWLFQKLLPKNLLFSLFIFFSVIYFSWVVFNLGWRAQVFSFTFLIATYFTVKQVFAHKTFPKFFPLLFLFWPSLHGGFVLGLFVQFSALVQSVWSKDKKLISLFSLLLITSSLITLVNPYGWQVHKEVLNHLQTPLGGIIAEWTPPTFWHQAAILLFTPVLLIFSYKKKSVPLFWTILLCTFAVMALTAKRNLGIWALFATFAAIEIWKQDFEKLTKSALREIIFLVLTITAILAVFVGSARTLDLSFNWDSYCAKGLRSMPCQAVEFIKKNPPEGKNVFSSYEWGGFIAWQLPQYKYFVDGRMPAWSTSESQGRDEPSPDGKSPYTTHLEILRTEEGFLEKLDAYKTDWLLIPAGTYLDLYLSKNETSWRRIYRDHVSVIYIKM